MKKITLILLTIALVVISCQKDDYVYTYDSLELKAATVPLPVVPTEADYFSDWYPNPVVCPGTECPDEYSFDVDEVSWKVTPYGISVSAKASAYVYEQYGDNCYTKAQVMLVKNGYIYANKNTGVLFDFDESENNEPNESEVSTGLITWTFPVSTDLTGVSVVAQAAIWGCFGTDPEGNHAAITGSNEMIVPFPN
jgi:hypothetical protein